MDIKFNSNSIIISPVTVPDCNTAGGRLKGDIQQFAFTVDWVD